MSIMGTSVTGMDANTAWLSAISQNVANANTTGYKTADTQFSDLVGSSGAIDQAAAAGDDLNGVMTETRNLNSLQGAVVGTSTTTDLAVQGNGFFVVTDSGGDTFLTRAGSFVPDASGNLVNAAGYYLMGYNVQNGPANVSANSLSGMQKVNVSSVGEQAVATTSGNLSVNLPSTATAVAAANLPSTNTAGATYTEKTSVVAYDNLGGSENVDLYMTKTGANTWEVAAYNKADAATGGGFPYSAGPLATQTLTFSGTTGQLTSSPTLALDVPNGQPMTLDLTGTTQLASAYAVNAASTNGNAPNSVSSVQITTSGTLSYQYANGTSVAAYDIPLANVPSPDNLTSLNGDVFQVNLNSGQALVGTAGSAGLGTINSSSLEQSTVDLATELTQMISAQSAYQANSKVFQTGADILDILNNLKP